MDENYVGHLDVDNPAQTHLMYCRNGFQFAEKCYNCLLVSLYLNIINVEISFKVGLCTPFNSNRDAVT